MQTLSYDIKKTNKLSQNHHTNSLSQNQHSHDDARLADRLDRLVHADGFGFSVLDHGVPQRSGTSCILKKQRLETGFSLDRFKGLKAGGFKLWVN
jgi:hypothetical protein